MKDFDTFKRIVNKIFKNQKKLWRPTLLRIQVELRPEYKFL
jgi:hypothetical protein